MQLKHRVFDLMEDGAYTATQTERFEMLRKAFESAAQDMKATTSSTATATTSATEQNPHQKEEEDVNRDGSDTGTLPPPSCFLKPVSNPAQKQDKDEKTEAKKDEIVTPTNIFQGNWHSKLQHVGLVETIVIESQEVADICLSQCLENHYEGLILRSMSAVYGPKKRNKDMIKYKVVEDDEFEIIDALEGQGQRSGTVIWRVKDRKNPEIQFNVSPRGTTEARALLWKQRHLYIGKLLTVEFQGRSASGTPRFAIGKDIRDYE
jgi:hypothetical protein